MGEDGRDRPLCTAAHKHTVSGENSPGKFDLAVEASAERDIEDVLSNLEDLTMNN